MVFSFNQCNVVDRLLAGASLATQLAVLSNASCFTQVPMLTINHSLLDISLALTHLHVGMSVTVSQIATTMQTHTSRSDHYSFRSSLRNWIA